MTEKDLGALTVKQLTEILNQLPDSAPILMCSDEEGNVISPLAEAHETQWHPGIQEVIDPDEYEDLSETIACLLLWPGWFPKESK